MTPYLICFLALSACSLHHAQGESPPKVITYETLPPDPNTLVREFHAEKIGDDTVRLTWQPPLRSGVLGYRIFYSGKAREGGNPDLLAVVGNALAGPDDTSVEIHNILPDVDYDYVITAKFDGGLGLSVELKAYGLSRF